MAVFAQNNSQEQITNLQFFRLAVQNGPFSFLELILYCSTEVYSVSQVPVLQILTISVWKLFGLEVVKFHSNIAFLNK
jgi:hypothetical protein